MTGALWYLIRTQAWNRLHKQASRLRQPRYAVAFALGIAYFWFIFLRPGAQIGDRNASMDIALIVLPVIFLGAVGYTWLVGSDRSALAFTRAEVAMLFPAPVSRRTLVLYRIAQSQFGAIFSAFIWMLLMSRGASELPPPARAVAIWLVFTTLGLHRLGVALKRASALEHGATGVARLTPALLTFLAVSGTVAYALWAQWETIRSAGALPAALRAALTALELPPAGIVLLPLRMLFEPLAAADLAGWAVAMLPALLILALHVWWVLGSEIAFEEAAAEASEKQAVAVAEMQQTMRGISKPRAKDVRRSIPLAATGLPAYAILWKNAVWMRRTNQLRSLFLAPLLVIVAAVVFNDAEPVTRALIGGAASAFLAMLLVWGPSAVRNDLRSDLQRLPLMRTLPLPGREVVAAEVLTGTLALALPQVLMLAVALTVLRGGGLEAFTGAMRVGAFLGAVPIIVAVNGINFTLHNGLAVYFPGWIRLGEKNPGGFEVMGQAILTSVATLLALVLALLLPSIIGGGVGALVYAASDSVAAALAVTGVAASIGLATEAWLLILAVGRAFDRLEPMQVG